MHYRYHLRTPVFAHIPLLPTRPAAHTPSLHDARHSTATVAASPRPCAASRLPRHGKGCDLGIEVIRCGTLPEVVQQLAAMVTHGEGSRAHAPLKSRRRPCTLISLLHWQACEVVGKGVGALGCGGSRKGADGGRRVG